MPMTLRWLGAFLIAGCLATLSTADDKDKAKADPKDDAKSKVTLSKEEKLMLDMTNQQRAKEKLPPLKPNALLFQAARDHSKNMAKQKKLDYTLDGLDSNDRIVKTGYKIAYFGENILGGPKLAAARAVDMWMKSEPHRKNILNEDFADIGIGVVADERGTVYYTQVFGKARDATDEEKSFEKVADKILELTNRVREKEGLKPLKMNALLVKAARGHSENMAKQQKLEHDLDGKSPADRVKAAGYAAAYSGENIAFTPELSADEAFKLWMESPPHKKNILTKEFAEIGIALGRNDKGDVYYTQLFGTQR